MGHRFIVTLTKHPEAELVFDMKDCKFVSVWFVDISLISLVKDGTYAGDDYINSTRFVTETYGV